MRDTFDETGHFHSKVNCVIRSVDGNFVGVQETCGRVRQLARQLDNQNAR